MPALGPPRAGYVQQRDLYAGSLLIPSANSGFPLKTCGNDDGFQNDGMPGKRGCDEVEKLAGMTMCCLCVSNDGCMPLKKLDDAIFGPVDVFART